MNDRRCKPSGLSEPTRLRLLSATGLLEIPKPAYIQRLVELAGDLLGAPIVLVTLVDVDRQVFVGERGLSDEASRAGETPLSHSFCQHVVTSGSPFVVNDSSENPLVCDNPATKELPVGAYAGFPVAVGEQVLGSFCAVHYESHQWTALELRVLAEFAEILSRDLENQLQLEVEKARSDALRRSNEELEGFARVVAHDLKEPLRGIEGCLNAASNHLDESTPIARQLFSHASASALRMTELLQALRDYSKLNKLMEEFTEVDLNQVCDEAVADLRALIRDTGGEVSRKGDLGLTYGNPAQLRQLMQNLIQNGLKFSRPESTPKVEISVVDGQLQVQDNGIGIEPKFHRAIFDVFRRLHRRSDYPGTGIGLAICKRIVELHRGEIWVKSDLDTGSCFCLTLNSSPADEELEPTFESLF